MAFSKTFLLVALAFAVLLISVEVSAETTTQGSNTDHFHGNDHGHDGYRHGGYGHGGYGHGGYGHGGHGHGGYGHGGHGGGGGHGPHGTETQN